MSLIHYYPGKSLFHKLDPRVKMIWLVCMFVLAFIFNNPLHLGVLLAVTLITWFSMRIPLHEFKLFLKALSMIATLTFLFQATLYPGTHVIISLIPEWVPYIGGMGTVTVEGLINGIAMVLRLFIIVLTMPMVIMVTPIEQLIIGLIKVGLPYEIAFAITTALNLVPGLHAEANMIVDAQKARAFAPLEKGGVREKLKAYIPLVVPLMVGSLKKGQQLKIAMESRAFGALERRTYITKLELNKRDYAFMATILTLTAICIILRVIYGFGLFRL